MNIKNSCFSNNSKLQSFNILYRLHGFGNALAFQHIDDGDIDGIEHSIKENDFIRSKLNREMFDILDNDISQNLSEFEFRRGDKILIKELAARVKNTVDIHGVKHFVPVEYANEVDTLINKMQTTSINQKKSVNPAQHLLKKLISTADRNSNRNKQGYRYERHEMLFASYIRMITGPLAYDTIQKNLEAALPSLASTNRYIRKFNCHVTEGVLRCDELKVYLEERNLPLVVSLSEDGTRIVDRVQYCAVTNQLIGFVPPIHKKTGMPMPFMRPARNAEEIFNHFANEHSISSFVNVVMAQPIGNAPPFCLLVFSSDNTYTTNDVINRFNYITLQLNKIGIDVLTIASDSDPRYNSAMRQLTGLGEQNTDYEWFSCNIKSGKPFYIQDPVHIGTKLRNFLLRFTWKIHKLPFGKYFIRLQHLYELMESTSKDQHLLTPSILNPTDRQNFTSVQRMCSVNVTRLLKEKIKNSDGTAQFLQIVRDVINAFLDKELTPLQRIRKIWYSIFLIRFWREFIVSKREYTLKNNFLTVNCYSCIEINAHSLVLCILHLQRINRPDLFAPYLYDSQACESTFRQLRGMTSTYSVVTNCSAKEILSRISKIQLQNDITHITSHEYVYPRVKNTYDPIKHQLPTSEEIMNEIELCKRTALNTATKFGLTKAKHVNFMCKINPYTLNANSKMRSRTKIHNIKTKSKIFNVPDLKNIKLNDYTGRLKQDVNNEKSSYAEIETSGGNSIIVKKTSLCWLLRKESRKLSSDRLLRVRGNGKKTTCKQINEAAFQKGPKKKHFSIAAPKPKRRRKFVKSGK